MSLRINQNLDGRVIVIAPQQDKGAARHQYQAQLRA